MDSPQPRRRFATAVAAAGLALGGCDIFEASDDDDDDGAPPPGVSFEPLTIYVSNNGDANAGEVDRSDQNLDFAQTFMSGNNEGIALDVSGHLYHAGDAAAPPSSIRVINRIRARGDGSFDAQLDREIPAPGSMNFKGFAIAHEAGLLIVADFTGPSLEIYGTAAGENATALASTPLAGNPWDVAYDEPEDRLFVALTNGTVLVVDDYVAGGFLLTTTRTLTPGDGSSVSNLHGIAYDAPADRLVVSDVGEAGNASDGKIFVIADASVASGTVTPARTLAGPSTMLGDPVDVLLNGSELRVAEKANDLILAWEDVFSGESGDVAPDLAVAETKPESLASAPVAPAVFPNVSDIDDPDTAILSVAATSNPASPTGDADIGRLNTDLNDGQAAFTSGFALENITFDQSGDAWVTFDDGENTDGGIHVLNRLAVGRDGEVPAVSRDRVIRGDATGLVAPKGIEIVDGRGLALVADSDAATAGIRAYSTTATGNVAPLFETGLDVPPWDLDYDPGEDRLFVALTDGTVAVFDDYLDDPDGAEPDRVIVPATFAGLPFLPPTNLHGIVHVAQSDTLIVSDIGSALIDTDGRIHVIPNASTAVGITPVSATIDDGNPLLPGNTLLGNPVDLAFDGEDLFVAEKAQGMLLRFDNVLDSAGGDLIPDASVDFAAAESVALAPDYLARRP
ncbi:MAG TPA: hypothetical protein VM616_03655 [Gammaproteobacteria bacterium]|nr:hypothetical protein [Gammaproteobacteria bacterium]